MSIYQMNSVYVKLYSYGTISIHGPFKLHQLQVRQSTAKSPIYNCLQNENVSC